MTRVPTDAQLQNWQETICERGLAVIKLRVLLKHFGQKRRGPQTVLRIERWLAAHEIYPSDLEDAGPDDYVQLRKIRGYRIGKLFDREEELQDRFVKELMPRLGLKSPKKERPTKGTRDKMDFLCLDRSGCSVVVELKRDAGKNQAVEQVLRYIGHLRLEGGHKDPRGILITGSRDPGIERALQGQDIDSHIHWYLYGLKDGKIIYKRCQVSKPTRK